MSQCTLAYFDEVAARQRSSQENLQPTDVTDTPAEPIGKRDDSFAKLNFVPSTCKTILMNLSNWEETRCGRFEI